MTLAQLFEMPKGFSIEEWETICKKKEKLDRRIGRLSQSIYDEIDSLSVLEDEEGSERWKYHADRKKKLEEKLEKAIKERENYDERR